MHSPTYLRSTRKMHSPISTYTVLEKMHSLAYLHSTRKIHSPCTSVQNYKKTLKYLHLPLLGNKCAGEHKLKTEKIREIVSKKNICRTLFIIKKLLRAYQLNELFRQQLQLKVRNRRYPPPDRAMTAIPNLVAKFARTE
jgi:hypothetical protein